MNIKDIIGESSTFNVQTMNVIVVGNEKEASQVVNPGVKYDKNGKSKWSPPLQQQLDVMKDAVGPSADDVINEPTEDEVEELQVDDSDASINRIKKLAAIFSPSTTFPSG